MKLLYILISSTKDCYYEQALLSVMSAKCRMPSIPVSLLVDDETARSFVGERKEITEIVDEIIVENIDSSLNELARSRFLKTNMRKKVSGDFLYVDVDTLWVNSVDENDFSGLIMAVPDGHSRFSEYEAYNGHVEIAKKIGLYCDYDYYFNSGCMFVRDNPFVYDFFEKWFLYWKQSSKQGVFSDQYSLNYVNYQERQFIKRLPDCYNVQISFSIRYLLNAKLIHYFSSHFSNRKDCFCILQKESFWLSMKNNLNAKKSCLSIINAPEEIFLNYPLVSDSRYVNFRRNPVFGLLCDIIESKRKISVVLLTLLNFFARWVAK